MQPDDSLSDDDGGEEPQVMPGIMRPRARVTIFRGPSIPNWVFGLGEVTVMWPPPQQLEADYIYQVRRAKSLGLPPPCISGTVRDGHSLDNHNDKNSADTNRLSSTDAISMHISQFRIGGHVRSGFGDTTQVYGIVAAVALLHRHKVLLTFTAGLMKWHHKKGRGLKGGGRYTIMQFRTSSR